jgi:hypothetical protein
VLKTLAIALTALSFAAALPADAKLVANKLVANKLAGNKLVANKLVANGLGLNGAAPVITGGMRVLAIELPTR